MATTLSNREHFAELTDQDLLDSIVRGEAALSEPGCPDRALARMALDAATDEARSRNLIF